METLPVVNIPFDKEAFDELVDETQKVFTQSKEDRTKLDELLSSLIGSDCWYITINNKEVVWDWNLQRESLEKFDTFIPAFLYDNNREYITDNSNKLLDLFVKSGKVNTLDIYMGDDWYKLCVKYEPTNSTFNLEYYKSARTDDYIQLAKTRRAMYELEKAEELQI